MSTEKLSSRLGFILLSAGCAVGIGNVWRFPYVAGQSGGGWFVLLYLLFLILVGLPVLVMEFACGRAAQASILSLHRSLTPHRPLWRIHSVGGFFALLILMSFYVVVTAWMVLYFFKMMRGDLTALEPSQISVYFEHMLQNPKEQIYATCGVCFLGALICAWGLQKGLERITKILMLALFILIIVLAFHSLSLPQAHQGLTFFLVPNWTNFLKAGPITVIGHALQQAFFTLSLGIGSMAIFGSYIDRSRTLLGESLHVVILDTTVALCAGLIVLPACFAFQVEPAQGAALIFITLPHVFQTMPGGRFWGSLFFLFMSFAAFSTVLAVFEGILAGVREKFCYSRRCASFLLGCIMPLLALPCIFGFNLWQNWTPLGTGSNILDLEDFLVSDLALPLGGLTFVLYCTRHWGWGWADFYAEANTGTGIRLPKHLSFYCTWILPILLLVIITLSLFARFKSCN